MLADTTGHSVFKLQSPTHLSEKAHARYDVPIKLIFVITYTVSPRNSGSHERGLYEYLTEIHTILTKYQLIPWRRVLLEKLIGTQLVKKLPAFYGTGRFITALQVSATCLYPKQDQSCPRLPPLPEDPPFYYLPI